MPKPVVEADNWVNPYLVVVVHFICETSADAETTKNYPAAATANSAAVVDPIFFIVYLYKEPAIGRIVEHAEVYLVQTAVGRVVSSSVYIDTV